ncbi:hypothetical protein CK203_066402 [Vitis vinifera]|uniref:Retrotransposon gag domain-containing protein n=1 Tax=Vitis vinifera TaxID=29760 RepID=A0A438FXG0_VITVI|nr:hypothetical protein CK203_066402 [Vitis vinifera]
MNQMAPLPGMVPQYSIVTCACPIGLGTKRERLVRIENPQDTELDICVNIMDPPPEDQNSQQGQGVGYKAPYCAPPTNFHGMESENPYHQGVYGAINACPHHGFDTWLLVSYFYDGMSSSMKQILETMCGGDFMSKNPEEAMDFLSYVAEVSRGWDEPNSREKGKFPSQQTQNPKAGMYMLSEDVDMKAKVATLARRLEELELKKMHEVQAISDTQVHVMPCTICQSCDHVVDECPTMPAVRNVRPPPYQPQGQTQAPQQPSSVEQAIANLNNIQYSISRLTNLNTVNEKGKFPSQPSQNPKGVHEVETQDGSSNLREVKAVITLRSGRRLINPCLTWADEELMSKRPLIKESKTKKSRVGRKVHPNQALKKNQG